MAKGVNNNYFSLDTNIFELTDENENNEQQMVSMPDENGDTDVEESYGQRKKPSNSASILADFDPSTEFILGTLIDGDTDPDTVLTSFNINTEAGVAPTVEVGGEEVITGSTQGRTVTPPSMTVLKRHKAQILFSAFSFTGTGVNLIKCSASGKVNLTRSPDAEGKAWDVSGGRIEVQATFKKGSTTAIALTAGSNWIIVNPLNLSGGDKDYEEYTVTLALNIDGVDPV